MDQILSAIGGAVSGFFANQYVQLAGQAILAYLILLWIASAYWAFRDMQARTANPIGPYLSAVVVIGFTPILFPFGLLLHRLVRPGETVAESTERALAEEAMLREIEAQPHCANCQRRVDADWIVCPTCRNQLRRICPACGKKTELDWLLCAWCGRELVTIVPATAAPGYTGSRVSSPRRGAERAAADRAAAERAADRLAPPADAASPVRPTSRAAARSSVTAGPLETIRAERPAPGGTSGR
jgi:hypothetical protein